MTDPDESDGELQEVAATALEAAEYVLGMSHACALQLFEGSGGIRIDGVSVDNPKARVRLRLCSRIESSISSVNVIEIHLDNVKRMQGPSF